MFIPNDILNIIYDYKNQLDINEMNKEFKKNFYYTYSSQYFTQISFYNKHVCFYQGKTYLLTKITNNIKKNGIYDESVIYFLK
jgi:hypothetical protein